MEDPRMDAEPADLDDGMDDWKPIEGLCNYSGCEGELALVHGTPERWDEPGQADHWQCDECGHLYGCDLHGDPDYYENY